MRSAVCLSCALLLGCSAIIEPDPGRLGGEDGTSDASGVDADTPPGTDGGQRDAAPPIEEDGGEPPACTPGARCDGETAVRCQDGVETRTECSESGRLCMDGQCVDRACEPGTRECTPDGTAALVCDERGSGRMAIPCEFGCEDGECLAEPLCPGLPAIELGDVENIDLCAESDGDTYEVTSRMEGCPANVRAGAGDRTYVLTLTEATDVVINLRDDDFSGAIDTVVYLRSACDDASSQLACDDDVPCSASSIPCTGGADQVRESRIVRRLEAGTYYIVADAILYSRDRVDYRCGNVQLRVERAP